MKKNRIIFKAIILGLLLSPSYAILEVHDTSVDLLLKEQITADQQRTSMLGSLNWTMGAVNSFYTQWGLTRSTYENFLNAHGLGGTKLGRYASNVFSRCIAEKMGSLSKTFKIPSVMVCGVDVAANLANYLGNLLNYRLNRFIQSSFGPKPKKKKNQTEVTPPGDEGVVKTTDLQLGSNLANSGEAEINDENGGKTKVPLNKGTAKANGGITYKKSSYYIINNGLIDTTPENSVNSFMMKTTTGDKENLGDINSPEIRSFYGKLARHYMQINKLHNEQFLRHSYNLKRENDFFNTTFVKNNKRNRAEQYTIDVPIPIATVEKSPKVGSGSQGGCLLTPDKISEKLHGCYGINFGISFIPQRAIVENPKNTLNIYTKGIKDIGNKIIRRLVSKNGSRAAKDFIEKFDIENKIRKIKRLKGYKESGINFATMSELIASYADLSSKLINLKSPDGRDIVKINYLKAILYEMTILNEQMYLYNKINSNINVDRYNELYFHVINIEKELIKIRKYETFFLRKILLK